MSEPLARLYDLALRTLDDQERRADALRGRLGPVLAAAALGVTLLSGPLVGGDPPRSVAGMLALLVAVSGFFVAVRSVFALLRSGRVSLDADPQALVEQLAEDGTVQDVDAFYTAMIARLSRKARSTARLLDDLNRRFTAILCGIHVMLCGLAVGALVG